MICLSLPHSRLAYDKIFTSSDSFFTYDLGKYYAIIPQTPNWKVEDFIQQFNAKKVTEGFQYSSGNNDEWVSVEELRSLIREHVDPEFQHN